MCVFNIKIYIKILQLNIVWRPGRDYSCHIPNIELHRKKTDTSSFLEKTANFVFHSSSNLHFFSKNVCPFPCSVGICMQLDMTLDLKMQFSVDPQKTQCCWRTIWQSIYFSYYILLYTLIYNIWFIINITLITPITY